MVSDAFSSSDFTVGRIADETIAAVRDNFQYFIAISSLGWIVHEAFDLFFGRQHLFAPTFVHVHSAFWMFELLEDELGSTVRSVVSAAIILRAYARYSGFQSSLRQDWFAIVRSIPSFALYAAIFAAIESPLLLLRNTALAANYHYLGLFLTIIFLLLIVRLLIALAWSVVIPLVVVERRSVLEAIRQSDLMTRRRRGTILLALALLGIALVIPLFAIGTLLDQKFLSETSAPLFSLLGIAKAATSTLGTMFASAGVGIVYVLLSRANQNAPSQFSSL